MFETYLLIHVQFSVVGLSAQSITDCYLVSVRRHHVEAEVKLVDGQIVAPGMILKHPYGPAGRGGHGQCWAVKTHVTIMYTLQDY